MRDRGGWRGIEKDSERRERERQVQREKERRRERDGERRERAERILTGYVIDKIDIFLPC